MSSGSSPEHKPVERVLHSEDAPVDGGQFQDRLSVILEQILSASAGGATATSDPSRADLLAVAAKYPSLDFCTDPVLMELIQAITRRIKGLSENRLIAMERSVAASLLEDQVSHGRLQHFWEELKRLVSHGH